MFIGESQAKGIVKRDLRDWKGTSRELEDALHSIFAYHKGITTTEKRDARIRRRFQKIAPHIYMREVCVPLTSGIDFYSYSKNSSQDGSDISKAERQKRQKLRHKLIRLK